VSAATNSLNDRAGSGDDVGHFSSTTDSTSKRLSLIIAVRVSSGHDDTNSPSAPFPAAQVEGARFLKRGMMPADMIGITPGALKLQTVTQAGEAVIHCSGALISANAAALKNYVKDAIPHAKRIVLDLNEVSRMDSVGLGTIVGLYVSARKAKCELTLVNYNKSIKELLGITNLLSVFEDCARTGVRFP
jgi:anti-sigma B factor antagonist